MSSRRNFIKLSGAGALVSGIPIGSFEKAFTASSASGHPFSLGIAGISFSKYKENIDKSIEIVKAVEVNYVTLKDFQLPYTSSQQHIQEVIAKYTAAGITVYGLGVINMKSEKDIDLAFDYANRANVKMIIASPTQELLPYLERKAKETGTRVAIHNRGPEDPVFPDVSNIYEKIKDLDPLIGVCMDIGHTYRCGHDPAAVLLKYHKRVYDMHIKDITQPTINGTAVINGSGSIDFRSLIRSLGKTKYLGVCNLEFEQKDKDPVIGIAESIGYLKGMLAGI